MLMRQTGPSQAYTHRHILPFLPLSAEDDRLGDAIDMFLVLAMVLMHEDGEFAEYGALMACDRELCTRMVRLAAGAHQHVPAQPVSKSRPTLAAAAMQSQCAIWLQCFTGLCRSIVLHTAACFHMCAARVVCVRAMRYSNAIHYKPIRAVVFVRRLPAIPSGRPRYRHVHYPAVSDGFPPSEWASASLHRPAAGSARRPLRQQQWRRC